MEMFCACSWRKHYYYYIGLKCDERFGYRIIAVNYGLMPNSKKFLLWGSHDPPVFLCVAAIDLWCSAPARRDGWPHWNFYTSPFRPIQDFIEHFCKLRSITSQGMHVIYCPTIEPWRSMNYKRYKGLWANLHCSKSEPKDVLTTLTALKNFKHLHAEMLAIVVELFFQHIQQK